MKDTIILNFLKDITWRIGVFLHSMLVLAIHFVVQSILNFSKDMPILFHSSLEHALERLAKGWFLFIGHSCLSVSSTSLARTLLRALILAIISVTCSFLSLVSALHVTSSEGPLQIVTIKFPRAHSLSHWPVLFPSEDIYLNYEYLFAWPLSVSPHWNLNSKRAVCLVLHCIPSPQNSALHIIEA